MSTLFEFAEFAPPAPAWAEECFYCTPDETGHYDEQKHLQDHRELTCGICGETSPNRLLFVQSHGVNLGASWGRDALCCTSLDLALNHLHYDIVNGHLPDDRDLAIARRTGWLIGPDGAAVRPRGWPPGLFAYSCGIALSRERGEISTW